MTFGVWAMFKEILTYCAGNRNTLLRHGAIPFIVIAIATWLMPRYLGPSAPAGSRGIGVGLVVAQLLVCVPMIVTWYRMIVLGQEEAARQPVFTFGRREFRLLGWQLAVAVAGIAAFGAGAGILTGVYYGAGQGALAIILCIVLGAGGLLGALAVINRISFVFALAATDQPVSFKASWEMTRGLTWPLLGTLLLIVLAQSLVVTLVNPLGGVVAAVIHSAATVFTFAAMATLFGFVYVKVRSQGA